jgi:sigma-B regulation protein RsbU (phosphoserine phosphatase)
MIKRRLLIARILYPSLIVAVAVISILVLESALQWVGQPFPGFFLDPNLVVSESWDESWTGPQAGLHHRDRVLSVNGEPVNSSQEVIKLARARGKGAVLTYTVQRGAETEEIAIPTMGFRWRDFVLFFAAVYVSGLAYLLLGLLVYTQCPDVDVGRVFLLFCLSFAAFAVTLFDMLTDHTFSRLWVLALPFVPATMLHLTLIFPERYQAIRRRPYLQFAPHLPAVALASLSLIYYTVPMVRLAIQRLVYAWGVLGVILVLTLMAYTYWRTRSAPVRRQAKVILGASAITFVPGAIWAIASIQYPLVGVQVITPFFILFPASTAYAIVKYRLFRLERLISQGMVYSSLTALLALLYFAFLTVTRSASEKLLGQQPSSLLAFAFVLLIAILFEPLRSRLQSVVDRTFYRERLSYRHFLADFARSLRTAVSLDDILAQLVERVSQTMHIAHASVLLRSEPQGDYHLVEGQGLPEEVALSLERDDPLIARLAQGEMVDIEAAQGTLAQWGVMLAVPLIAREKLIGLLALGPKVSGQVYTSWDRELLSALSDQTATSITIGQLVSQVKTNERVDQELKVAREIQTSFLPEVCCEIPGFEVAAYWQAAREVGGDFYDFIPLPNGRMGFVVADVSDKGVPAALFMALCRALIRASAVGSTTVDEALQRANELILADASSGMFVTLLYAILDPARCKLTYVNAGHNPPILSRRDRMLLLRAKGMALGVIEDIELERQEVELAEGDVVVFYTDGVTEAINEAEEEFGQARLAQVVVENRDLAAQELIDGINEEVTAFIGGEPQFDDFTLVVLKRLYEERRWPSVGS